MTLVPPRPRAEQPEFEPLFGLIEQGMGFLPNSLLTMGHWPDLLRAFSALAGVVQLGGGLPQPLRRMVALMASTAAGCRYCQAHTAHGAAHGGVDADKLEALYEFETSPLFTDAERAALRLARDASLVPNAVEPETFAELRRHFDERELVELVAQVALFGWLNRWNDTMATTLEQVPATFAASQLDAVGWTQGKHQG